MEPVKVCRTLHSNKTGLTWVLLHSRISPEALGYIPGWLDINDPRPAREQLNSGYAFGGWQPFEGFKLSEGEYPYLTYPGDPPTIPIGATKLRDEQIIMYQHAWVAIIQKDRSFEVCRMD